MSAAGDVEARERADWDGRCACSEAGQPCHCVCCGNRVVHPPLPEGGLGPCECTKKTRMPVRRAILFAVDMKDGREKAMCIGCGEFIGEVPTAERTKRIGP